MTAGTNLSCVTMLDTAGRTPLHYAAMHGRTDAVSVLVQHGASVHAADTRGHFQPLHLAADAGQCDAIAQLLALGADIEARTVKGFSSLVLAVMKVRRWQQMLSGAMCLMAAPGCSGPATSIHCSWAGSDVFCCTGRCRRQAALPSCGSCQHRTACNIAGLQGPANVDAICTLVEHRADVRAVTDANSLETPLHIAARSGRVDIVQRLMRCDIDLLPRTKARRL
jgi:ankyrin repeat protein